MSDGFAGPDRTTANVRLAFLGIPLLVLLAIEFLLGMGLNLYVPLGTGTPLAILESSVWLLLHVGVGVLLLGIASNIVRTAARAHDRRTLAVSVLGLLSGIAAFAAGLAFTFGSQSPTASYAMAIGFLGMVLEAGYLLRLRPVPGSRNATAPVAPTRS
jgi:cation transport ATPase